MRVAKRNSRHHYPTFNNLFENIFSEFNNVPVAKNAPAVNISESEDIFTIEVALPGISKKEVNIDIDDNLLTISRVVNEEKEAKKDKKTDAVKYTRREFNYSSFKRTFNLPDTVDTSAITAKGTDGILVITLPKKEEAKAIKRTIKIG